jgi:uncharacterized protein (TIGR03437 family)
MTPSRFVLSLLICSLQGQSVITTIAGTDYIFPSAPMPALQAPLGQLDKIVQAPDGSLLVADEDNTVVVRIDSTGTLSEFAGNGILGISGDGGPATAASLAAPFGLAFDRSGNLYIAEFFGCLRKVSAAGIISTVTCDLLLPSGVAVDSKGNVYVSSSGSHQVKKVTPAGSVIVVAGTGVPGFGGDGGPATQALLNSPLAIAIDQQDNVFISEPVNNRVREILSDGTIITAAGGGTSLRDGVPATTAALTPLDLAFDSNGNLFVTDLAFYSVRKIGLDGTISRIAGNGNQSFAGDGGPPLSASFALPGGLYIDPSGNLYVSDRGAHRLRYIGAGTNVITTIAGNGRFRYSPDGGKAVESVLAEPDGMVIDSSGNVLFSDDLSNRVRKLSPNGILTTIAGTGDPGSAGDNGPATQAQLSEPSGLAQDSQGNLYIVDSTNARVRKLAPSGIITTIAGNGAIGFSGDGGPATQAQLGILTGVGVGPDGSVYIADPQNRRVRRVTAGKITTFAGNGGASTTGDGGPASAAGTPYPFDVAVDKTGVVYISDYDRIRRVGLDGNITTFVTPDVVGSNPGRLITDAGGNVWVSAANRIVMITPTGAPTVIAGSGLGGFSGDGGPPQAATLVCSCGIALDPGGLIYISDQGNNRVRVILSSPPTLTASVGTLALAGRSTGAMVHAPDVTITSNISGAAFSASFSTAQGGNWLSVMPNSATAPASVQITADPSQLAPGTYQGTVSILSSLNGAAPVVVQVTFTVGAAQPASLAVNTAGLSYSFLQGDPAATQTLVISNSGDGTFNFQAAASTDTGGNWLSVTPATGTVVAGLDSSVTVTADPSKLTPGTYTGLITISNPASATQTQVVRVSMIVSPIQRTLLLSQYGFTFTALEGGPQVPFQTFGVLNTGQGSMPWTAQAIASAPGASWLSISPASGTTDAASLVVPFVQVTANTTGLTSGTYYGKVVVTAPDAGNSPQIVSVVLNVLPKGSNPGLLVRPTGLIFTTVAGGEAPGSQNVTVTNLSNTPVSFISGHLPSDPNNWFTEHPSNGTFSPGVPFNILIVPNTSIQSPGLVRGTLTIQPNDPSFSQQIVDLLQVVIPGSTQTASAIDTHSRPSIISPRDANSSCSPAPLIPVFSQVSAYNVVAGWPNALEVTVVDSCGVPLTTGRVTVSFTNGDPPLSLASLKDGRWTATWTPARLATQVTLTANAVATDQTVTGTATFQVNGVQPNSDPPVVQPGNVVTTADPSITGAPIAPGSVISIFGTGFANSSASVANPPYDTQLNGTSVVLGGALLPISAVAPGRIDAVVPFDAPVNARQQILIQRGVALSSPQAITVSSAQPAIYSSDGTGAGQALIYRVASDGTQTAAGPSNPAQPGDKIVIICAGLGQVDQTLQAGSPAPGAPPAQVTAAVVSVRLGSSVIMADSATLVPGKAGVYQVQVTIPGSVQTGDAVSVAVLVNGQSSQPGVTLAIAGPAGNATPTITSINTAYGSAAIAQNDFIEIHGTNLAASAVGPSSLATQLGGVSVSVNGNPALLYYVSLAQINALTPLDNTTGPVSVVVTSNGVSSASFTANLQPVTPAFLRYDANGHVTATHADYSYLGPASLGSAFTPGKPGETIITYAVGFGLPSAALVPGAATQTGSLPALPVCQLSGAPMQVAFAGLGGFAGLYQLNLTIPTTAAAGDNPLSCTYGGQTTPAGVVLSVQP